MNSVGNELFEKAVHDIIEICKVNKAPKELLENFVVNKVPKTVIYNLTDPLSKVFKQMGYNAKKAPIVRLPKDVTRIGVNIKCNVGDISIIEEGSEESDYITLNTPYTIFSDNIFTYAKLRVMHSPLVYYIACYWTKLDENRIVTFYEVFAERNNKKVKLHIDLIKWEEIDGTLQTDKKTFMEIISSILSVAKRSNYNSASQLKDVLEQFAQNFFTNYLGTLSIFKELEKTNKSSYACYVDKSTDESQAHYIRANNQMSAVKYYDKPIYLVLEDNKEKETKISHYKRRDGKIEYAFSWIVRGHYRRMHNPKTWGKDKNGQDLQGATWIETYFKGNLDAPLRKREVKVLDKRTV